MLAQRIHKWGGPLNFEEVPDPHPGDGEVLIEIEACSIGLTVLNAIRGDLGSDPGNLPRIPGHEFVGRIVDVGESVDPGRVGERVMAYFYLFCGRCARCVAGTEPLCENLAGYVGVNRDGGYGRLCTLPDRNAVLLRGAIDAALATAIPDAVATPVHVARHAAIERGERVAVIAAAGGVGVHMVQVARVFGAEVVGLEATEEKLRFLEEELGVVAVDSSSFSAAELPADWTGKADAIVDLLGTATSLDWSARHLATRGRLILLTTFHDVDFRLNPREFVFAEASVLGSRYASRDDLELAADLVASNQVRAVVSRRVALEGVEDVHQELREGRLLGRGAVVWSQS
jgi:propanol-preferring alcohol dehydrogenase